MDSTAISFRVACLLKACALAILVPVVCMGANGPELPLSYVQELLASKGARSALDELYSRPESWELLLEQIESGSSGWIRMAVALRKEADGAAGHGLVESLGEALAHAPTLLLTLVSQNEIDIGDVCRGPDVDDGRYSSYEANIRGLNSRISVVSAVDKKNLAAVRSSCLRLLATEKKNIARYFEVEDSRGTDKN